MSFLSIRTRSRLWEIALASYFIIFVWLLQTDILTRVALNGLLCNLPLTFTIVWGAIFSSRLQPLSPQDLKMLSLKASVAYQSLSGSVSAAFVGAFFAALYASVSPVYPIGYPLIGWIAGYFSLRNVNHAVLVSIPLVLFGSILAEFFNACQLSLMGRPEALAHYMDIALTEACLNTLIAPVIVLPMKRWYQFKTSRQTDGPR